MTHLTETIIAIEVPNDAINPIWVGRKVSQDKYLFWMSPNGIDSKTLGAGSYSLIGITPLNEEQWKKVVEPFGSYFRNYNPHPTNCDLLMKETAVKSGLSLMESKGLSPDKKYAIVKIETKH